MNVESAIKESCDVFFYELSKKIGINKIAEEAKEFGLGKLYQIGFENEKKGIEFTTKITKSGVLFYFSGAMSGKDVDIYVNNDVLLSAKVGSGGALKIHKRNKIGRILLDAINFGEKIRVVG